MFYGEVAALCAAVVWASATWIYSQFSHQFTAMQLNIVKGTVASAMMLVVLPFIPSPDFTLTTEYFFVLAVSGVIGIAIGDSAYFAALKRIGPNKTLLLESLAPPLSGVLALVFLGTVISIQAWLGVVITTFAVALVVFQPNGDANQVSRSGVGYGLLASVCQASGVVISHYALVAGNLPPLLGALIRLAVGVLAVVAIIWWVEDKPFRAIKRNLGSMGSRSFIGLLSAIFVGTFLALWLQQVALKHANPAIAQTLIATSPLFMLVIYAIRRETISKLSLFGTLFALLGISLFFL
ncbi:DMT family transporter [Vibrio sp. YMD68]|uniref:DMT family transporter n=1 Tax=Vibrio sp. YMD68 TaxID=3042300 RepID=UPI00249BE12F|nr:DMT family transporter [Vibrio sp. YMD68]WGV98461.1 DMT family transporter [Vibrio sp. YMD68]